MSTKEEIAAAAAKRFKTKDVDLGGGVKVVVRELSKSEYQALRRRLFICDAAGNPVEKNDECEYRPEVHVAEEWLAATMIPAHTVDELLSDSWPDSLKSELYREALKLNGFTVKDAVGN